METPPPTRRERSVLVAILALAAGLRVWGIGFGLPHLEARPDELEVVERAIRLLSGDLNPHFFHYPSLYFYLLGAVYGVWGGVGVLFGTPMADFLAALAVDPSPAILLGRWVSAFAGVATVYAAYRLGREVGGVRAGLAGAAFMAFAHLHVRDSHFATTDVTMTLFITLAVWQMVRVAKDGGMRAYVWAGVWSGLAVSTKYVGLILPAVLALAHLVGREQRRGDRPWGPWLREVISDPAPWTYAVAGLGAFLLTTPYALLDWGLFSTHFAFQMGHLSGGHGLDLGIGGIYHLEHTLPKGLGWGVFLVAVVGAGWAKLVHSRVAAVLFFFPALFYLSTLTSRTVFLRYMIPMLPFFCVAAGWGLAAWTERLKDRRHIGLVGAVLLLGVVPIADAVRTNSLLTREDTRLEAARWLLGQVGPEPATVHQTGAQWGRLQLPLTADSLEDRVAVAERARAVPGLERVRAHARMQARARLDAHDPAVGGFARVPFDSVTGFGGPSPDWVVVMRSPLEQYSIVPEALEAELAADYTLRHTVRATRDGEPGWYDQHDAWYLPFRGMAAVTRPGPDVHIYRRESVDPIVAPATDSTRSGEPP